MRNTEAPGSHENPVGTPATARGCTRASHRPQSVSSPSTVTGDQAPSDRKSTRLNSSHVKISYAVFCLKKKKKPDAARTPATARPEEHTSQRPSRVTTRRS